MQIQDFVILIFIQCSLVNLRRESKQLELLRANAARRQQFTCDLSFSQFTRNSSLGRDWARFFFFFFFSFQRNATEGNSRDSLIFFHLQDWTSINKITAFYPSTSILFWREYCFKRVPSIIRRFEFWSSASRDTCYRFLDATLLSSFSSFSFSEFFSRGRPPNHFRKQSRQPCITSRRLHNRLSLSLSLSLLIFSRLTTSKWDSER